MELLAEGGTVLPAHRQRPGLEGGSLGTLAVLPGLLQCLESCLSLGKSSASAATFSQNPGDAS